MNKNAYRGHRFPPAIIQVTVWMYASFTLSLRDVEELLAERGLDISYETVRRWFSSPQPDRFADETTISSAINRAVVNTRRL